jgi:6,7-dimethyl-8-ribityllumazine synthase
LRINTDQRTDPPRRPWVTEKKHNYGFSRENPREPEFHTLEGALNASGKRLAIVVSRFNAFITERLLASAVDIVRVPGAFEIPLAARKLAETKKYHAIICLGCLLRGDTAHYDVIVNEVTRGIGQSAQETGVPHSFGVLTCETLEQAIDRAGLKMGNKGFDAALAAVEMASLVSAVGPRPSDLKTRLPRLRKNDEPTRKNKPRNKTSKTKRK